MTRLVTWNCAKARLEVVEPVVKQFDADIVVLQEVRRPGNISSQMAWAGPAGKPGILVMVREGLNVASQPVEANVPEHFHPFMVSGRVHLQIFGVWSKMHNEHRYIRGVAKALEIYAPRIGASETVVLGDFNSNSIWDGHHPKELNHSAVVRKLGTLGLESAYHTFRGEAHGKEQQPTFYFHRKAHKGYHIDYCFLPVSWRKRIVSVEVLPFDCPAKLSDHRPVIVEVANVA